MTSQSLTTNKKRAGFSALFGFTVRQFWTTALLFTIILFFILPIPVMMTISDRGTLDADEIVNLKRTFAGSWNDVIRYFVIIVMSAFGVVVSCARFGYLKNKVSVDFYHSLPVKRGQLFLTQIAVSALSVAIPYIINILFTIIVFASNALMTETIFVNILIMSAEAFIYSILFFSLSTLIGMISGLTAVQLTLTVVATFILPAIYLASLAFINIFSENMWFDYYLSQTLFEISSPALRLVFNSNPLNVLEAAVFLLISAIMLIGAYAIYMRRKSERAGTPVVFAPLGEFIKYVLVFLGTLCGGLLFYFIMESLFWTVFGMICGTVLVFMLVNTILQKTARSMFKGIKGLAVYGGIATVCFIMLISNVFGINTRVPSPEFTSRVVANIDNEGGTMEFSDKEVIEALHTLYTESEWHRDYSPYADKVYSSDSMRLEIVFYPKLGIPVAKSVYIYNRHDFLNEMRVLLDSAEFKEQYINALDRLDGRGNISVITNHHLYSEEDSKMYNYNPTSDHWYFDEYSASAVRAKELGIDILVRENKNVSFDFFQQQNFGYVYAYSDGDPARNYITSSSRSLRYPLLTSMNELVGHYTENGTLNHSPDEFCENLAKVIGKMEITKLADGVAKTLVITDKAQILEALKAANDPLGNSYSPFTFIDTEYRVNYSFMMTDAHNISYYYDEYGNEEVVVEEIDPENVYVYENNCYFEFLLGRVPDFVIEYFAD